MLDRKEKRFTRIINHVPSTRVCKISAIQCNGNNFKLGVE